MRKSLLLNDCLYFRIYWYLRKLIYPKLPIFRYVGILPPLRTPNHPLEKKLVKIKGESIRDGGVLSSNDQSSEIEIGLEQPMFINIPNLPIKKQVTLRL
ncbi:MAG: putative RNA uridine N3 methyltransferase [Candidatus Helarchaeota archaeon]